MSNGGQNFSTAGYERRRSGSMRKPYATSRPHDRNSTINIGPEAPFRYVSSSRRLIEVMRFGWTLCSGDRAPGRPSCSG